MACLSPATAAEVVKRFDVPAGDAAKTLKLFAAQSGVEVLFASETTKGIRTNPIKGEFAVPDAAVRMLAGTLLYVVNDTKNGVLRIARNPDPNAQRAAQK